MTTTTPKALIFDLNGTMINDMDFHSRAWYHLLNDELGGNFTWKEVKQNMYGKNPELLVRMFGPDRFTQAEMETLSVEKEKRYQKEYLPQLTLLPGLMEFLEKAHQAGIPMAIGSAAIPFNIDFVLDNLNIRHYFKAIVSADDVLLSKPHPETYLKVAAMLQVNPADCLVFEDVPKGGEAANNAGMKCVILTTTHEEHEFKYLPNVLHFAADFTGEYFDELV
ncbi:HAD superfamily hydrolase (TIGR01509 family) [Mucilaginibacter yixingensis]|uniref:HAD superfamily hydrolase (TIGR01509 family) n=1 Tax=Mucilaginibacter yixingensis TaxID=1295612 RepID=A0A2T5JD09_9SPHI|nr:HAD family phosphatase [Mucilaginibacter yixingensis]PTQ99643.1 HAD superfamily hydrolase (TIGR01509 family) [Mucilaginibacter yixingensis]